MNKWKKFITFKLATIKELFDFIWKNRLWWMLPIVIIFLLLGAVIWLSQSSTVAPFIYTLF